VAQAAVQRGLSLDASQRYDRWTRWSAALQKDPERVRRRRVVIGATSLAVLGANRAPRRGGPRRAAIAWCTGAAERVRLAWNPVGRGTKYDTKGVAEDEKQRGNDDRTDSKD